MFKSTNQPKAKSPYQPKLLQHLIDSSDDENDNSSNSSSFKSQRDQDDDIQDSRQYNSSQFNNFNQDQKRSQKSFHTAVTQQTTKSNITKQSSNIVKPNQNSNIIKPSVNQTKPQQQSRFSSQAQSITSNSQESKERSSFNQQNSSLFGRNNNQKRPSHSPVGNIKYDTLKLSEYDTQQVKKHEQLYQNNLKQFKEKFYTQSNGHTKSNFISNLPLTHQQENEDNDCLDSLQAMKRSNLNKKQLSRKSFKNQSSTPSSRIKFLQQLKDSHEDEEERDNMSSRDDHWHSTHSNSEVEKLRQQLKRSKDVIKTLGLKNTDLQKTLETKNIKLQELQSDGNSRLTLMTNQNQISSIEKATYEKVSLYMKEKVRDFMDEIKNIKMNPSLQQSIENFLAQILQINQVSVNKKLGICQNDIPPIKDQKQPQNKENLTPNRLSKSIFNPKYETELQAKSRQTLFNQGLSSISQNFRGNTQTESHITIVKSRQNAFMTSKLNPVDSKSKYTTVRLDLSQNKQNITPNKRPNADEEFRQLEKSLQKLKSMQTQLYTPQPKNQFVSNNRSFIDDKNEYSIINKSYLSRFGQEDNSAVNVSVTSNLDRSKSRRKKIFAQTNQK